MTGQRPGRAKTAAGLLATATLGWPMLGFALIAAATAAVVLVVVAIMTVSRISATHAAFTYQCQSRLGASVGVTASVSLAPAAPLPDGTPGYQWRYLQPSDTTPTTTPTSTAVAPTTTAAAPQPNPFTRMTAPAHADTQTQACVDAVQTGAFVAPPLRTPGGPIGRRAADQASRYAGLPNPITGDPGERAASLIADIYDKASGATVVLPGAVAAQVGVGERVDPQAISPGDLVYYAFTPDRGPTAVMIALTPSQGVDLGADTIAVTALPTGNIIVKRPETTA